MLMQKVIIKSSKSDKRITCHIRNFSFKHFPQQQSVNRGRQRAVSRLKTAPQFSPFYFHCLLPKPVGRSVGQAPAAMVFTHFNVVLRNTKAYVLLQFLSKFVTGVVQKKLATLRKHVDPMWRPKIPHPNQWIWTWIMTLHQTNYKVVKFVNRLKIGTKQ